MEELLITESFGNQIADVIELKTNKHVYFDELDWIEQLIVLRYIQTNKLPIKAFGQRWYNILNKTFYIEEFLLDDAYLMGIHRDTKFFSSFGELYEYTNKDVYQEYCYYGYTFSEEEISKYKLRIKDLSAKSFITYNIDLNNFDYLFRLREKGRLIAIDNGRKMSLFIDKCNIKTYKDIIKKKSQFISRFEDGNADLCFFAMLMDRYGREIEDKIIDYVCNVDIGGGLYFWDILARYGVEAGQKIIDNYNGSVSYSTARKRIKAFKNELESYNSSWSIKKIGAYLSEIGLYCVEEQYYSSEGVYLSKVEHFVSSLDEFKELLSNDLRGAKLSNTSIKLDDVKDCQIDRTTLLPKKQICSSYKTIKEYRNGTFYVIQKWYDESGELIIAHKEEFKHFFDFLYYLKNNLEDADLLMCEGVENLQLIKDLDLSKAIIKSGIREKLDLKIKPIDRELYKTHEFKNSTKYELSTLNAQLEVRQEDYSDVTTISYITDIHLLHRFKANKCISEEDVKYTIRKIANAISYENEMFSLIGGDTSSNFDIFLQFVDELKKEHGTNNYFFVLGNHELWPFQNRKLNEIVEIYRKELNDERFHLLQNDLIYLNSDGFKELSEEQLLTIDKLELRKLTREAKLIILGGIGFSGKNTEFNANNGIYQGVVSRTEEIEESKKFYELYKKVADVLYDRKVIVFTHMPMIDWADDNRIVDGFIYVSGHNHRNYYHDDNRTRIYADNQIGYKGKNISLKKITIDYSYDWFSDYKDGIYEITKNDYEYFYRGIGEYVTLNRDYSKLYMIKREKNYMFLIESIKGKLQILNGGAIKNACNHTLDYFYNNLVSYSKSVTLYLSKYDQFQKEVAKTVKAFGGYGNIHGCIVDIDYMNHLYLNPLDGSITPYYATTIIDKRVYNSLGSLLKCHCPELYINYEKLLTSDSNSKNTLIVADKQLPITNEYKPVYETEMYRVSRILKGLQFTTKNNIVRLWSDAFVSDASEDNGKLIVKSIIDPSSVPIVIKEKPKPVKKPSLSSEEKQTLSEIKYKDSINKITNGKIEVVCYLGSKAKAEYKCTECGHIWQIRPDHFKYRQNCQCPICTFRRNEE